MLTDERIIELRKATLANHTVRYKQWADSVAFARAVEREALEEAANVADREAGNDANDPFCCMPLAESIASEIRALIDKEPRTC